MMYDAYQGMADVGDRMRQLAQNAQTILGAWAAHAGPNGFWAELTTRGGV